MENKSVFRNDGGWNKCHVSTAHPKNVGKDVLFLNNPFLKAFDIV